MSPRDWRAAAVLTALPALLALPLLSGCCGGPAGSSPPVARGFFGINGGSLTPLAYRGLTGLLGRQLGGIEDLGVGFVRAGINWSATEPRPPILGRHRYRFGALDRWVEALARHHLRWQVVGLGPPTPAWAADRAALPACGTRSPPARPADLADLLAAIARRYGRNGSFWSQRSDLPYEPVVEYEVWNEENHSPGWCPRPDPTAYADVYAAAHEAVHAVDPDARVLVGGLGAFQRSGPTPAGGTAIDPGGFLARMIAARPALRTEIDAIAAHVYDATPVAVLDRLAWFRRRVDAAGLRGTPLSLNETGWYTRGRAAIPPIPEERRASYLRQLAAAAPRAGCGLIAFAPYTWATLQRDAADPEDWYGIANPATGAPYPSAVAYGDEVKLLEAGAPQSSPTSTVPACRKAPGVP